MEQPLIQQSCSPAVSASSKSQKIWLHKTWQKYAGPCDEVEVSQAFLKLCAKGPPPFPDVPPPIPTSHLTIPTSNCEYRAGASGEPPPPLLLTGSGSGGLEKSWNNGRSMPAKASRHLNFRRRGFLWWAWGVVSFQGRFRGGLGSG